MKSYMWTACALTAMTITAILVLRLSATAQDKAVRVRWEYKASPEEKLEELGNQGWEVVAVTGGEPYVESSRTPLDPPMTINTIKYAPLVYHLKRQR